MEHPEKARLSAASKRCHKIITLRREPVWHSCSINHSEHGRHGVNEETELKLRVPERALASVRRNPLLSALRQGRGARRHLLTVYYDTPSLALARQGLTLRVRRANGRWIQGVKLADDGGSALQRRPEIETEIEGDTPDIARIPDDGVRRM